MAGWLARRYIDLLGSIYIYNEHRGYTAIDRALEAIRARSPDDHALIAAVESHRADEREHYLMFRRWFERRGVMQLAVDRKFGHIDRFVEIMFRRRVWWCSCSTRCSISGGSDNCPVLPRRAITIIIGGYR